MSTLTPNCDAVVINKNAPRLSIEYKKAKCAVEADYQLIYASNQAMAKRIRKDYKNRIVNYLGGKVSWAENNKHGKKDRHLIVAFEDGSVANF